jgi:drug/metabolite transporter (DMT)-like permease
VHSPVLLTFLAASAFIVCDVLSAHWGKGGSLRHFGIVMILAPTGYLLFGWLNRIQKLAVAGVIVNLAIAMGTVAVGLLLFQEQLTRRELLGLVLGMVAIYVVAGGK